MNDQYPILSEYLEKAKKENTTWDYELMKLGPIDIKYLIYQIEDIINDNNDFYDLEFYKSLLKHTKGILEKAYRVKSFQSWSTKDHV